MPRLIIRKSALSTTHYCRRWFPGISSAKNWHRRKASDDSYRSSDSDGRTTVVPVGRGHGGEAVGGGGGGGGRKGLIGAGLCVLLNICRWFKRSRCACLLFLLLFFTFTFYTLTSDEFDDEISDDSSDASKVWQKNAAARHALPQGNAINAGNYRLAQPNCNALENGDKGEIGLVEDMLYKESRIGIPNSFFRASTTNCSRFRELRHYAEAAYSVRELQTPLAYVIAVKRSAEQVERLLRATYAPQNVYCLYSVHPTTSEDFTTSDLEQALQRIAGCFTNIFIASSFDGTQRGGDRPEVEAAPYRVCLNSLLAYTSWRYVLLVAEGDFPTRTNRQIIDGVQQAVTAWRSKRTNVPGQSILPPLNKGNDYSGYVLTRKMAQFAVQLRLAKQDDYKGKPIKMHARQPPPSSSVDFADLKVRVDNFCPEEQRCALTSSDLQWLLNQPALFARRFDLKTDYVVIGCLENRLRIINSQIEDLVKAGHLDGPPKVRKEGRKMGRQEGRQMGRQEGRKMGRQEGRQMGRQEGHQEGHQESDSVDRQEGHHMDRQKGHQMALQDGHKMDRKEGHQMGRQEDHQERNPVDGQEVHQPVYQAAFRQRGDVAGGGAIRPKGPIDMEEI